jgi:NADPH-dependent 2,4-dienoyl-CoA reductase/sulfur reductase-like enzyme
MPHYTYLIVGGGMTGDAAIGGIREVDPRGSIGLISAESHPPYDRPPLSKGLWKDKPLDSIWRKTDHAGVTLHLGAHARTLDAANKRVVDDKGTVFTFDKLLLATGGTPRRLPFGGDSVIYFRTVDDYQRLQALAQQGERFAIIGGGFIGSEVAAALAMSGKKVVMVFPEDSIGSRIFPADLARFLNEFYREKGVEVLAGENVTGSEMRDGKPLLKTHEREIVADGVVAGIGIQPNIELAEAAGLKVDNGIRVDDGLRTSNQDIYAAGDVANFHSSALGQHRRVEHEDNANVMGRLAGQAMAGRSVTYDYLPFFYSDLFELGFEAVGEVDARLETVEDWKEPYREGVVYYLRNRRVRGVLLWNVWGQVDAARKLIAETGPFRAEDLRGRLPAAV